MRDSVSHEQEDSAARFAFQKELADLMNQREGRISYAGLKEGVFELEHRYGEQLTSEEYFHIAFLLLSNGALRAASSYLDRMNEEDRKVIRSSIEYISISGNKDLSLKRQTEYLLEGFLKIRQDFQDTDVAYAELLTRVEYLMEGLPFHLPYRIYKWKKGTFCIEFFTQDRIILLFLKRLIEDWPEELKSWMKPLAGISRKPGSVYSLMGRKIPLEEVQFRLSSQRSEVFLYHPLISECMKEDAFRTRELVSEELVPDAMGGLLYVIYEPAINIQHEPLRDPYAMGSELGFKLSGEWKGRELQTLRSLEVVFDVWRSVSLPTTAAVPVEKEQERSRLDANISIYPDLIASLMTADYDTLDRLRSMGILLGSLMVFRGARLTVPSLQKFRKEAEEFFSGELRVIGYGKSGNHYAVDFLYTGDLPGENVQEELEILIAKYTSGDVAIYTGYEYLLKDAREVSEEERQAEVFEAAKFYVQNPDEFHAVGVEPEFIMSQKAEEEDVRHYIYAFQNPADGLMYHVLVENRSLETNHLGIFRPYSDYRPTDRGILDEKRYNELVRAMKDASFEDCKDIVLNVAYIKGDRYFFAETGEEEGEGDLPVYLLLQWLRDSNLLEAELQNELNILGPSAVTYFRTALRGEIRESMLTEEGKRFLLFLTAEDENGHHLFDRTLMSVVSQMSGMKSDAASLSQKARVKLFVALKTAYAEFKVKENFLRVIPIMEQAFRSISDRQAIHPDFTLEICLRDAFLTEDEICHAWQSALPSNLSFRKENGRWRNDAFSWEYHPYEALEGNSLVIHHNASIELSFFMMQETNAEGIARRLADIFLSFLRIPGFAGIMTPLYHISGEDLDRMLRDLSREDENTWLPALTGVLFRPVLKKEGEYYAVEVEGMRQLGLSPIRCYYHENRPGTLITYTLNLLSSILHTGILFQGDRIIEFSSGVQAEIVDCSDTMNHMKVFFR